MAEGARLESVYTATYRGFESPPHRHILRRARMKMRAFFLHVARLRGDENPRPGVDSWRQPAGQTESVANRLPAGRAKRVNPTSPPYFNNSSYFSFTRREITPRDQGGDAWLSRCHPTSPVWAVHLLTLIRVIFCLSEGRRVHRDLIKPQPLHPGYFAKFCRVDINGA